MLVPGQRVDPSPEVQPWREDIEGLSAEERRRQPRLYAPFAARLRSVDAAGEAFESDAVLDNFSAGGLYVRLPRRVEPGTKVFAVVRIATGLPSGTPGPRVAVRGVVLRTEPQPDGRYGLGVRFTRHRFL